MAETSEGKDTMNKRPDHYFCSILKDAPLLSRHCLNARKEIRLAKTTAFRMAKAFVSLTGSDPNWLLDHLPSQFRERRDGIDAWLAELFAPYAIIDDYRDLLRAVSDGMKLKDYLRSSPVVFLGRRTKKAPSGSVKLPDAPDRELPLADQVVALKRQNEEFRRALHEERRLRIDAERRVAKLERACERLASVMAQG